MASVTFGRFGQPEQLVNRRAQQALGMSKSMVVASACVDNQTAGVHRPGQTDGMRGVVDRRLEASPIAASKTTRPKQIGDFQTTFGQQVDSVLFSEIAKLLTPYADRLVTRRKIIAYIFLERPPKRGHFVHRQSRTRHRISAFFVKVAT